MSDEKSTHKFEAEVEQVLRLVINSLYSNREIFLRELLSNASDALDKLRFESLTNTDLLEGDEELKVRLIPDEDAGTLTVWDNGIGMNRESIIANLGTVARSGSREFLSKLEEAKQGDVNIIGQFGVGFYSSWLVADKVEVLSRAAGEEEGWRWTSNAKSEFTVESAERECQGTSVILHLGDEHKEFVQSFRLRSLVERYSDYLNWPIELREKKEDEYTFEAINRGSALWQRTPSDVEEEQYHEFYKHLSHDWDVPLAHKHFKVEGMQEFAGLLFIPKHPPFDLYMPEAKHGVRLYVRRVFIMDNCEELLPRWLRFMRGVVDSEDLPLNVSREILQDSKLLRVMRKQVIKRSLELLADLAATNNEEYLGFWKNFGTVLKEGLHLERDYRDELTKLLRFESDRSPELRSLAEYKERMKEGQGALYYALGESRKQLESSPHLEALRKRGYEIIFMIDPVDQWAVAGLEEIDGVKLISATSEKLELDGEDSDKDESSEDHSAFESLCTRFSEQLADSVGEARISSRLTDSPVCLVIPAGGLTPH